MVRGNQRPAGWFYIVGVVLLLWGMMGVFAFYSDVTMSAAKLAELPEYDRQLLASRPGWYIWFYGIATWSGLFGAIALLARRALAYPLFLVSLVTTVVMFGYIFAMTDLIAVKGAAATVPFPLVVIGVAVVQVWFAGRARQRGWIG